MTTKPTTTAALAAKATKPKPIDAPKVKKTMAALAAMADKQYGGHMIIRKTADGWNCYFLTNPRGLHSDMGDAPLPTFTAAAWRCLSKAAAAEAKK